MKALKKGYIATYEVIIYDNETMKDGVSKTIKANNMEELSEKINTKNPWKVVSRE